MNTILTLVYTYAVATLIMVYTKLFYTHIQKTDLGIIIQFNYGMTLIYYMNVQILDN